MFIRRISRTDNGGVPSDIVPGFSTFFTSTKPSFLAFKESLEKISQTLRKLVTL